MKKRLILKVEKKKVIIIVEKKQIHAIFGTISLLITMFLTYLLTTELPELLSINAGLIIILILMDIFFIYTTISNWYAVYKQNKK